MISLKENDSLDVQIKGSQIMTYSSSILHTEVIRYRKKTSWGCVDSVLTEEFGIQYKKEVSMITSLIASARRYGLFGAYISLHKDDYSAANKLTHQGISYIKSVRLLHLLDEAGYITLYVGYYDVQNECGVKSFFICNDKMNTLWEGVDTSKAMKREEDTIIVRDSETKENLPTRQFKGIKLLRSDLQRYNELLSKNNISIDGQDVSISYKRVFHDNLSFSGRYYTNSTFQTIEKEHRPSIKMNGIQTIELDYSSMHPRILYSLEGYSLNKEFSPYEIDGVDRSIVKLCMLMMLYSCDKLQAQRAIFSKLKIPWTDTVDIVNKIEEHNSLIANRFYTKDLWKVLQNYDSRIATNVLMACIERRICVLPYHDSFRVLEGDKEILRGMMFEAWKKEIGNTNNCVVEEKK